MSITNKLFKLDFFSRLKKDDDKAEEVIEKQEEIREKLDIRLEKVVRATLNGETEWFLTLSKKDPNCILEVFKECADDDRD